MINFVKTKFFIACVCIFVSFCINAQKEYDDK